MAITGFLFGLGHLLMFGLGALWQLYLFYGIIIGIGLSSVDVIPLSTTARWFIRKRGLMTGIVKLVLEPANLSFPLWQVYLSRTTDGGLPTSLLVSGCLYHLLQSLNSSNVTRARFLRCRTMKIMCQGANQV